MSRLAASRSCKRWPTYAKRSVSAALPLLGSIHARKSGTQGNALKQILEQAAKQGSERPAPRLVPPPLVAMLPVVNTGIAISVVFDMVTKPASVPLALDVIAIGVILSAAMARRKRPAPAVADARLSSPTPTVEASV